MEFESEFWYERRDLEQEMKGSAPIGRWQVLKAFFVPLITSQLCPGNRLRVGGEERAKREYVLRSQVIAKTMPENQLPFLVLEQALKPSPN